VSQALNMGNRPTATTSPLKSTPQEDDSHLNLHMLAFEQEEIPKAVVKEPWLRPFVLRVLFAALVLAVVTYSVHALQKASSKGLRSHVSKSASPTVVLAKPSCNSSDITKLTLKFMAGVANCSPQKWSLHGVASLTAVATCISDKGIVSLPCAACLAEGENCKQQSDSNFQARTIACNAYYSQQSFSISKERARIEAEFNGESMNLLNKLTKRTISPEQWDVETAALNARTDKQRAITAALHRQAVKLTGLCPFAHCQAQARVCTGTSTEAVSAVMV